MAPAALLLAAVLAGPARADTGTSTNWAGYAVHHAGVRFSRVIGQWRQPTLTCTRGSIAFSAMWVGIGGFSASSTALEQIGTEADCNSSGRQGSSTWYEMVPAPSLDLPLHVHPGDLMRASVTISGRTTTLSLVNATRHASVTRRVRAADLDLTSAEWIVEAPSECTKGGICQTLPLADFGSVGFSGDSARASAGHNGAIADRTWGATRIRLVAGSSRRFINSRPGPTVTTATPSGLNSRGSAFTVRYASSALNGPFFGRIAQVPVQFPGAQRVPR